VPANAAVRLAIYPNNAANVFLSGPYNGKSPSHKGLLLMYTDAPAGQEASSVSVLP